MRDRLKPSKEIVKGSGSRAKLDSNSTTLFAKTLSLALAYENVKTSLQRGYVESQIPLQIIMWGKYCQPISPPGIRLILAQRTEQLLFVGSGSHLQPFIGVH